MLCGKTILKFKFLGILCAPIIRSVFGISHYWPLFVVSVSLLSEKCNRYCNKCTNNVISCDYNIIMILINIEKMLNFIEKIRNQKVDIISDQYPSMHLLILQYTTQYTTDHLLIPQYTTDLYLSILLIIC